MLSGYRIMWMIVMFDLPVMTKAERKAATGFRNFLLDEGFEMAQYSVYMRYCASREKLQAYIQRVHGELPLDGDVQIITLTDKQYAAIQSFSRRKRQRKKAHPDQLALF